MMIPESRLIRSELVMRDLSLPEDVLLARKSLVRWLALSLGLIMPNESRTLMLDILEVLVEFHVKKEAPETKDVLKRLEKISGETQNPKAVYYHLLKLKETGLISRRKGRYYFGEGEGDEKLYESMKTLYSKKMDKVFSNIKTSLDKLENTY